MRDDFCISRRLQMTGSSLKREAQLQVSVKLLSTDSAGRHSELCFFSLPGLYHLLLWAKAASRILVWKLNPQADYAKKCDFGEVSLSEDGELVNRIRNLIKM